MKRLTRRFFTGALAGLSAGIAASQQPEVPQSGADPGKHPQGELPAPQPPAPPVTTQLLEHMKRLPWVRRHFGLKVAYCQHPMYLIADEDRGEPTVGERTPPWGAPDAREYAARIRRNLASLDTMSGLRLNYDFAAVDVETIARDFPDIGAEMKRMHSRKLLAFVNGTYAQAHLQVYGSESNWRDFQYGHDVYRRLFDVSVNVFASQETALHEQLPQILCKFGYTMIVAPFFPWFMDIVGGPLQIMSSHQGTGFMRGDEFVEAQALDGSSLPMYLTSPLPGGGGRMPSDLDNLKQVFDTDLYGPPRIWPYLPDMNEVDQQRYQELSTMFDFVLFEEALPERLKAAPPRTKARLHAHWSYSEGVWAEALLRKDREAQEAGLLAESLQAMAKAAGSSANLDAELRQIWRTILKYHNHDVSWAEVTDLRRQAIDHLAAGIERSTQISQGAAQTMVAKDNHSIAVFNVLPAARRAVVQVWDAQVPGSGFQKFEECAFGVCDLPAGGFRSFPAARPSPSEEIPLPQQFATPHYTVRLSETGLLLQITTADGKDVLEPGEYLGGELRALIHDEWRDNRSASSKFYQGEACHILVRSTALGSVPVRERYFFFHGLNAIKAELEFDFNGNEIGYFWLDETKINVYYPTRGTDLHHDIAFGYVAAREGRPLLVPNWICCGGLAYINRGTVKHWVRDGVVANVLAWGGSHFDNRMHFDFWVSKHQYDVRLYGRQKIEYWLIPYGGFDGNRVVRDVNAVTFPVLGTPGGGGKSWYSVSDTNLAITAVYEKEGQLWARGYQLPSRRKSSFRNWEIFERPLNELATKRSA